LSSDMAHTLVVASRRRRDSSARFAYLRGDYNVAPPDTDTHRAWKKNFSGLRVRFGCEAQSSM
jgi:hypothetical protein